MSMVRSVVSKIKGRDPENAEVRGENLENTPFAVVRNA